MLKSTANRVPIANRLLAILPPADYQRLLANLDPVTLTFGEVLCEAGDVIRHVYFPNDALVSLLTPVDRNHVLEVGLVGREGLVGIALALGIGVTPVRALVQGSGTAMRMKAAPFRREIQRSPLLRRAVHFYTHALMSQVAKTAACNRFHKIEARLARWLLMTRDRVGSGHFRVTQEFLGYMLGVRRVGVTHAAQALKHRKLIEYSRGQLSIVNEYGLAAAACSCYETVKHRAPGKP